MYAVYWRYPLLAVFQCWRGWGLLRFMVAIRACAVCRPHLRKAVV